MSIHTLFNTLLANYAAATTGAALQPQRYSGPELS